MIGTPTFRRVLTLAAALMAGAGALAAETADTAFPQTTLVLTGPHIRHRNKQLIAAGTLVSFRAVDGTRGGPVSGVRETRCRLDEGPFRTCGAAFTVPEGFHRVQFFSLDNAGNEEPMQVADLFVDGRSPETRVVFEGASRQMNDEIIIGSDTLVALEAQDPFWTESAVSELRNISFRIDGQDPELFLRPFQLEPGRHTVEYSSADRLGNKEQPRRVVLTVEESDPSVAELASDSWAAPSF